jgi:hypothetical protein
MKGPFALKVRAGEQHTWDISLLMFLLCNSSHQLLRREKGHSDQVWLKLLSRLRRLRNTSFGHIGSCSLSDEDLENNVATILTFAKSALNAGDDLEGRIAVVLSEEYSFGSTAGVNVERWQEARQNWEDHFQGLEDSLGVLGARVETLALASEAADSLTHTKLDAVLIGQQQQRAEEKTKELRAKESELRNEEHAYRTQASVYGLSKKEIDAKMVGASCEMDGPLGKIALLREELERVRGEEQ